MLENVHNCSFSGDVKLGLLPLEGDRETVEPGLEDSWLKNVTVMPGVRIMSSGPLCNLFIAEGTLIENCGAVEHVPGSLSGCGALLELGVETGERTVPAFPLLSVEVAAMLSGGSLRNELLPRYIQELEVLKIAAAAREISMVGSGSRLVSTPLIRNCHIGDGVRITAACAVTDSTLLGDETGGASVSFGALVRNSVLKWNSLVDSMAVVESSVLDEASTVEKHGKLSSSFLGPNSVLAEGEITASLAGPFTAAHHQSLLIAARWPEGRGNLGYGANVGSNHTSRLPDQEIRPGEGMFFGLSCSVKFPADFSRAPYSIIATGVTTLPQRMEFPFSLICEPFAYQEDVPPAFNQLIPAWVLSSNLFSLERNRKKFQSRNRAAYWKDPAGDCMRTETAELMLEAVHRLGDREVKDLYTHRDIPGTGKNFVLEEHVQAAIEAYGFHLLLFALEEYNSNGELSSLGKRIVDRQLPDFDPSDFPAILEKLRKRYSQDVASSREKDHVRGASIIDDYSQVRQDSNKQ